MMPETDTKEILALDLDWDFLHHLAISDSVNRIKAEAVTADLLEDEYVTKVFEWQLAHYREHGKPATPAVLEAEFDDLALEEPLSAIGDLIERLRERYMRNHGLATLDSLIEKYHENPLELAHAMYDKGREFTKLIVKRGETYGTGDFDRSMAEYDKMVLRGKGPSLGFEELDNHFHGQRGITFMLGAPKSYKSWFTVNAVVENIVNGKNVTLYSLELPAHETYNRVLYATANVAWWKFLKGAIMPDDRKRLKEAAELLDGSGVLDVIKPPVGERKIDMMIDRAHDLSSDVVFIDQLQYMENDQGRMLGSKNDTGDYWDVCGKLRDYSDELPTWVVHQFNRSVMNADELPSMQQIKGSAAIEETATLALGLWANKDMRSSGVVNMGTLASRNYEWYTWEFGVSMNTECSFTCNQQIWD